MEMKLFNVTIQVNDNSLDWDYTIENDVKVKWLVVEAPNSKAAMAIAKTRIQGVIIDCSEV